MVTRIDDVLKLYNDYCVSVHNCVDLSLFARTVDNARWQGKYNHPLGLARLIESYEYRILVKGKITRSNWEAILNERQQECQHQLFIILVIRNNWPPLYLADASNDAHAGFSLYKKLETLLPSLPTPPERVWYAFDAVNGRLCKKDGSQWNAENPNYDPGPPPPPRLPREIKASMIITAESNAESNKELEPSAPIAKAHRNENRFQRRRRDRNHFVQSNSQQPSAGNASGSTQQQPRSRGTYENNPQPLPRNSGNTVSQHRQTGAQGASSTQCRVPSSNIRNERAPIDNGHPRRRPHRRPRHPASQDTPTATHSWNPGQTTTYFKVVRFLILCSFRSFW